MASSRHEGRKDREECTSDVTDSKDRDRRDRRDQRAPRDQRDRKRPYHGHRTYGHEPQRDTDYRHNTRAEPDHRRDRNHDRDHDRGRHGSYKEGHRQDRDRRIGHHSGHDQNDRHIRRRAEERSRHSPGDRHGQDDQRSSRERHGDHHDSPIMLQRRTDHARREESRGDFQEPGGDDKDALFHVDTRGDPLVWQFQSNNLRHIPSYDRFRRGCCVLGSKKRFTFDQDGSKTIFSVESDPTSRGSVFRERNCSLLRRGHCSSEKAARKSKDARKRGKKLPSDVANTANSAAVEAEFVPLAARTKRKRSSDRSGSGSESDSTSQSNSSDDDSVDFSVPHGDQSTGEEEYINAADDSRAIVQNRLAYLSRRVKEAPQDIDAWLELVDLQDQQSLLLGNDDVEGNVAEAKFKDETTGIATVKLAILESALQQNQQSSDRERLQIALMREGSKVWTSKKTSQRWASLAQEAALSGCLSFPLWKARLDFEMTNLSTLTVDRIKLFCSNRLQSLEKDAVASTGDAPRLVEIYSQMTYIFLRATRFLYDAGFRDLAAAAWQATLESSFARPLAEVKGASLGDFWDSEVQRVGEDGSEGWRAYAAKVQAGEDAEEALLDYKAQVQTLPCPDFAKLADQAQSSEIHDMDEYLPLYAAWAAAERQRAELAKLPARVIDDIDDGGFEDVFRVAVFADFETLLFHVPDALLAELRPLLVDAFLLFCQLPPAFGTSPWIEDARNDPFLATIVLSQATSKEDLLEKDVSNTTVPTSHRKPPELFCDGSRIAASFHVLFSLPGWFRYLPDWLGAPSPAADEAPVPPFWVANTLRQLVRSFGFGQLGPYSLAVDALVNPAGVKKSARAMIKLYISHKALYEAYALSEVARGNIDVACAVLASATANVADMEDELSLRTTWAWIELEHGQRECAIRRLVLQSSEQHEDAQATAAPTSQDDQSMSPAALLRLRHVFQTGMDDSLSMGRIRRAALHAQAAVLLSYLSPTLPGMQQPREQQSRQGNLFSAMAVATSFTKEMQSRGHASTSVHEEFLQCVARIIYFHATHGPYRPADLQAPLEKMVGLFPRNGIFLRLFAWVDPTLTSGLSRLRTDNALQKILDTVVLTRQNDCPSSRAFVIRLALQGGHGQGHAARAEFERALGGSHGGSNYNLACHGSARLWQAFVRTTAMDAMATATLTTRRDGKRARVRGVDHKLVELFKEVYYRAVRACPGSKDLLLECFGPSTGLMASSSEAAMSPSDLRAVYQTITSKGLRVHMDLGEMQERARKYFKNHEI